MLLDDVVFHLRRYLPRLTDNLTTNYRNTILVPKFTVEIINSGNSVKITMQDNHNLQVNDHVFIQGIKYKYSIDKIERIHPNSGLPSLNSIVAITTTDPHIISINNYKKIEIANVVSDTLYNGIFDVVDAEAFSDAFFIDNSANTVLNVINNEGDYLVEYYDDDYYYCTPNGFKAVESIIDDKTFTYSIDENNQYNMWIQNKTTDQNSYELTKPTPVEIDYSTAVIKANIKIASTLDINRAIDKYATQELSYQGNTYLSNWDRTLWLFVTSSQGEQYSEAGITTSHPDVYVNNAMELRIQKDSFFSIVAVCRNNDELLSGGTVDFLEILNNAIVKVCVGRTFFSVFQENNYKYSRCVPVDNDIARIVEDNRIMAYKNINFKISTKINDGDLYEYNAGIPIKAFNVPILFEDDKNENVIASGEFQQN